MTSRGKIKVLGFSLAMAIGVIAVLGAALVVSRPMRLSLVPGSVQVKEDRIDGDEVVIVTGQLFNLIGQIQAVGVRRTGDGRVLLDFYVILFHPLSQVQNSTREWPIILLKSDFDPGEYEIHYWSRQHGYLLAGSFVVSGVVEE